ncbi:heavy-metal-associated domain-containing protein [Lacticaseibacillus jixianensis]|uniref:Heavy-metal-associated domain-containing protein n=1 Tax=Lacticaseibacillus jixianensis TaxID=2486012 RepID=A0ABW4B6R1_9LACO|nr:heavy-metal-associated domain-containing protein [Lacticaseibacillus jixianensis]
MSKKITMQLDQLTCPSCLTKIEGAVKQQPGVANVKVLFNAGKVKADFDDSQISAEQLSDVVTKLGYEVKKVRVKDNE